jgi:riboflavin biosynthesis pyrimidine reductase
MAELAPLEVLFENEALPRSPLPEDLRRLHGGDLGFDEPCLYTNFVETLDGVVAIPTMRASNDFVAGSSDADRFLMGILRAFADAVLIGSGVLRASPEGTWRAEKIYPPAADGYAQLRRDLGSDPLPEVAVVTGSGAIDVDHPLFRSRAVVLTSEAGAGLLEGRLPSSTALVALGSSAVLDSSAILGALHARGHVRILAEAGPHTFGGLLEDGVVDELFLTTSPKLVGEAGTGSRYRLVEGADLVGVDPRPRLVSVRRHESHLFLRYRFDRAG